MQKQPFEKHVWAEIDLEALRYNFRAVKARAGELPLCAVVKADSYGHGAVQCARVFAEEGAAWLAVSCLTEAVQLRKAGQTLPILILGHVQPAYAAALIQNDITVACYSLAQARALSEAGNDSRLLRLGLPDTFIEHGEQGQLLAELGLDTDGIVRQIRAATTS